MILEPLALLHGREASLACSAGLALPLAGGPVAFALLRRLDGGDRGVVSASAGLAGCSPIVAPTPAAGLPAGHLVMGILNATPDSFSDGGRHADAGAAIAAGLRLAEAGADLVDVGGESTRPGALPVPPGIEQARILPVVRALAARGVTVSVDTRNASTMRAALAEGARLVNDVSGLSHDPHAAGLVARAGCPVVLMHMRGTPQTMAGLTGYDDVALEVVQALQQRIDAAVAAGIDRARIVVDPGIGFAKTEAQNLELLRRLPILANLGCRVLLGVSRKGFVGRVGQAADPGARLPGSIAAMLPGLALPGTILRVHDVAETRQAVRLWQAIHG